MKRLSPLAAVISPLLFGSGCGIGTDTMLFTTNTTIGVDIDSAPPGFTVAYSRQELVIAPQYQGGHACAEKKAGVGAEPAKSIPGSRGPYCDTGEQVPSVMATIKNEFLGFLSKQSFLTGHAADLMAYGMLKDTDVERDKLSRVFLSSTKTDDSKVKSPQSRPFFFGTHTVLGVDVKLNPATGAVWPQSFELGLKRKELAILPLIESTCADNKVVVTEVPSVFAGSVIQAEVTNKQQGNVEGMQVFATGRAAEYLAGSKAMRTALLEPTLLGGEIKKVRDKQAEEKEERAEQKRLGLQIYGRYNLFTADADKVKMRAKAKGLGLVDDETEPKFLLHVVNNTQIIDGPVKRSELMKVLLREFP